MGVKNMNKILPIFVVGVLIISGLGAVALHNAHEEIVIKKTDSFMLSTPTVSEYKEYVSVELAEATSLIMEPGEPVLPKITKVYVLPFTSTVKDVSVKFSEIKEQVLSKEIRPASEPIVDGEDAVKTEVKSSEVYSSYEVYPKSSYTYRTSTGLDGKEHVVFLTVQCYPVRYSPARNILYYSDVIDIKITYEQPSKPITFPNEYDLLIIAPSEFEQTLQPLVDHKNDHNLKTILVTLDEIYAEHTEGRDDQENIKLYIKDAIEEMGITYVLLVGGMKGQTNEWYLPIRYGHSPSEDAYISDLYYSDIYKENGTAFEDWDSNGNNNFAEYGMFNKDIIDGSPDVYVGRLACRSLDQVTNMINKIINYEKNPADNSWFKKMLLIGGDTYPASPEGFEAEIDTNLSASHMNGFEIVRLWASLGALTGQEDVEQAINNGAGFIHMAGHANPASLVTFPPYDAEKENKIIILAMYNLFDPFHVNPKLNNDEQLPVIVVGGCHNSQFNVSFSNMVRDIKEYGFNGYFFNNPYKFYYMDWVPKCWSWWLTSKEDGGAIVTMGNTGLGMGLAGFDYTTGLDGWLFPRYFYHYGQLGEEHVGMAHSSAITDYVNEFDINKDGEDRQMIQQWALLGDPSLVPGGYHS
jgi:hypothetical protein